ncbi:MAG: hypothetical protein N2439_04705, partial [Anaerolineae bacterium]|nr:hypothetical protein [Anaerolineae bacterium]
MTLRADAPGYQMREMRIEGNRCGEITIAGFTSSEEPGRPRLPYRTVLLGVPPDAELSLEVVTGSVQTRKGTVICPAAVGTVAAGPDGRMATVTNAWAPDATIYATDAFYPAQLARLVDLGFMRSQRIVRLEYTPTQINPKTGEVRFYPQVQLRVRFGGRVDTGRRVDEPADFETIFKNALLNYETARHWRAAEPRVQGQAVSAATAAAAPAGGVQPPVTGQWLPPTPAYRIAVDSEGIYQLTQSDLANAGLPVARLDPSTLKMYNFGQEIAIQVIGEGDGRLDAGDSVIFYGRGVNTRYTNRNIYWLTYGGATGSPAFARS